MARKYSQKKVIASRLLELLAKMFLFPFTRQQVRLNAVNSILIVEPFQMGDVLSTLVMIDPLIRTFPNASIHFLTKESSGRLLVLDKRLNETFFVDVPWADHGIKIFSLKRVLKTVSFATKLRQRNFDLGIDTRGDVRSQILMTLAGCKIRLGYTNYLQSNISLRGRLLTHPVARPRCSHRYEWNSFLLTGLGMPESELLPVSFPVFKPSQIKMEERNFVLLHVGGGWEFRRWPPAQWVGLIDILCRMPFERVVVIGGPSEQVILSEISAFVSNSRVFFKTTNITELVELTSCCRVFIGLDSGPMNLAASLDKRTVGLFGPGDASMWRPLNNAGTYVQRVDNFECSPCLQQVCIYPVKNCMHEIRVDDVMHALDRILKL